MNELNNGFGALANDTLSAVSAEELSRIDGGDVVGMLRSLQAAGLGTLSTTPSLNGDGMPGKTTYIFTWK
jgi:hypothetical protein